jgi:DNA-directed RNA polymerase sigma subunit (sigma70/sigma32)
MQTSKNSNSHSQQGLTLQEIASMVDLTKERVRQIEARALMKLRKKMLAAQLNPSDLYRD